MLRGDEAFRHSVLRFEPFGKRSGGLNRWDCSAFASAPPWPRWPVSMEMRYKQIILWEPIINGSAYMREMIRINLSTQASVYKEIRYNTEALIQMMKEGKTVNVDGYEMAWPLYEQISRIDLLTQQSPHSGRFPARSDQQKGRGYNPAVQNSAESFGKL